MRNTLLIASAFFFIFFGFSPAQQYLVVLFNQGGRGHLALISLLLLYGAFILTGIIVTKIIPVLGGLKRSLLLGALAYVLFTASVSFNNIPFLLLTSVTIGIGAALLWVSSGQIIADSSTAETAGRNFAYQTVGQYAGMIAGIYAGSYLSHATSLAHMYLILAASILLGVFLIAFIQPAQEQLADRPFKPLFFFDKRMLALFPLLFGTYFLQGQVIVAMNFVVVTFLGVAFIPHIVSAVRLSSIIGSFSIGSISDRYAKSTILAALTVAGIAGTILFISTSTFVPLLFGAVLLGFSTAAVYPVVLAWLKKQMSSDEYLYALGVFHVYNSIGIVSAIGTNFVLASGTSFIPGVVALMLAIPGIVLFQTLTNK